MKVKYNERKGYGEEEGREEEGENKRSRKREKEAIRVCDIGVNSRRNNTFFSR